MTNTQKSTSPPAVKQDLASSPVGKQEPCDSPAIKHEPYGSPGVHEPERSPDVLYADHEAMSPDWLFRHAADEMVKCVRGEDYYLIPLQLVYFIYDLGAGAHALPQYSSPLTDSTHANSPVADQARFQQAPSSETKAATSTSHQADESCQRRDGSCDSAVTEEGLFTPLAESPGLPEITVEAPTPLPMLNEPEMPARLEGPSESAHGSDGSRSPTEAKRGRSAEASQSRAKKPRHHRK